MSSNSKPYPLTVGALKTYADLEATYPLRALLVAGYVYDDAHEFADDITDELSGSGYARVDLDNVLYTATDSDAAITADDVVFASLTATDIDGVIVISDQGADSASPLVGYYAIGPLSVSTETLTVPWPSGQVAYFTTRDALTGEGIVQTIVAGDNITVDDTDPANPVVSATGGGGGSGPLDAEQFDRTSTTPGAISVDLSSVTKAGAVIFVDGASDVTVTALPDSSAFPVFFVYVARITGTGVCTLTFDGGAPVYDGDQYTATSEANGQAAIGLVPLGSGDNWLVDSVFPAAGGSGPDLSDADPEDLGTADPGTSPDASRADHVHATEVGDAIADGVTDLAPSQNAVYDALAGKAPIANAVHTGTFEVVTAKHTGNTGASTTPLLITGANASGAPASGAHVKGEIAGDDTGKLWYCTVAGTPGTWVAIGGSGVAADPIFDAKGDLPVGTGADTAAKLTVGANGQVPMADSGATTGLRYGTPAAPAGSHAMPYVSGKVYAVPRRTFGTASYAANYVPLLPYVPHATNTFDRIQFYATSTGSGNARLGIFNSDGANGYASTLLIDAGQTATTSGGDLLSPSFSQVLTVGVLYWIGVNVNVTTVLAHRDCTTQGSAGVGFGGIGSDTLPYEHCYAAQTYGAMPSTLATVTPYAASTPYLTVRSA